MKSIYILIPLLISLNCKAQNRNAIWCFGDSAGINWINPQQPQFFKCAAKTRGTSVSIADSSGNLLFYAYTRATLSGRTGRIFNKNHFLMQNGESIVGQAWYHEMIILPDLNNSNTYFLFSIDNSDTGIVYSVIDMSLNNGLGAVTQKNMHLFFNGGGYVMTDCLTAIKHGNGRDWWLICRPSGFSTLGSNNYFIKYLVQPSGISGPFVQSLGNLNNTDLGQLIFNNTASKAIFQNINGLIDYFDFDRCTGMFSNHFNIRPFVPGYFLIGASFSPNDSILYTTTSLPYHALYQYDLTASNILASETLIGLLPNHDTVGPGLLQIAPDNKIYWGHQYYDGTFFFPYPDSTFNVYNTNLSVINQPNNLGTACDFQPFSFYLGGARTYYGLPNNPNYDLGPLAGSICDTLTIGITEENISRDELMLFPNPCESKFSLAFTGAHLPSIEKISIINSIGEEVKSFSNNVHFPSTYDISDLPDGFYVVEVYSVNQIMNHKLLKLSK